MNIGIGTLRRVALRINKRFAPKGLILVYHRVAEVGSDPWSLCVTPRHFAEHLEVLQKYCRSISLGQLVQTHRAGNIPCRAVAVTFDDGYADNLYNARPLLERYDIPAMVFVTTGYLGHEREFWWDELDRLLLQPGTLPERLSLSVNGSTFQWELGEGAFYSEYDYRRNRDRKALEGSPGSRHFLYYSVWQRLQPLPEAKRRKVLAELVAWAGAESVGRLTHRSLSLEEVVTLAQEELVEVGSHTVTHPVLSALPAASQRDEIQQSKAHLEDVLNRPVTSLAYPHGDYTGETVALVREAGFTCACSSVADIVWRSTDCFQLPRFNVKDWDGEEFTKWLFRWFHG